MNRKIKNFIEYTGGLRLTFLLLLFAVLPSLSVSSIIYFLQDKGDWLLQKSWLPATIFYSIATILMAAALTPTTVVAIISGYFFGWWGLVGLSIAYLIACYFGLHFGAFIYHYFVGDRLFQNKKLQQFLSKLHDEEFLLIFFGKLSPVFPFAMMNIVFAALQVPIKNYLIASIIGASPRLFLFFYLGKNANEIWQFVLSPSLNGASTIIPVLLVVVSSLGIIWILRKAINKV